MTENQATAATKSETQQTRNAIRRSWSPEERDERRRHAASRQRWLFDRLSAQWATVPERAA